MEFIVCKFGGSSLATKEGIQQVAKILTLNTSRRCVVLSAPGKASGITIKVTDLLIRIAKKSLKNDDCSEEINQLKQRYRDIYLPLGISDKECDEIISDLETRVAAPKDNKDKYHDSIVASGEDFNARLFARYLTTKGIDARYVSPKEAGLIVTDSFGDAQPLRDSSMRLAQLKKICSETVVVFPGFYGITQNGDIATFSRGGSDLTGAILADSLDAIEYENWTDVNGIYSTNPNLVDSPLQIPALTYKEMRELSYIGFNVFHEEAVRPAMDKKIPIRLRNTFNLDNSGTLIVSRRLPSERDVVGIASGGGYASFNLQKFLMNREKGFGRKLLSIIEKMGLSYEHCPSGVDNMSVILDQSQLTPEIVNNIIRRIEETLQPDDIKTEFGIALVAVVGEGLIHKVGVLAQTAQALGDANVNIKMANQGSSEISMIFGIDASDEKKAVGALYNKFFG
ncbi:MAG: aspartate kinase [Chitinivibrionales bacterium]|nr:aspartate kinase [Chitinivibrionales bacterium]